MENTTKEKQAEIHPLLYNIALPIALSITGIVISALLRKSRTRMDLPEPVSRDEYEDDDETEEDDDDETEEDSDDETEGEEEENETEDDGNDNKKEEEPVKVISNRDLESTSTREISILQCNEEGSNIEEEIEVVNCRMAALEEKESVLESQFYDYCNMKEQESAFQKLQIMCLGLKLELLESQNQRLEATIGELRGAMEQVDVMRSENRLLQREVKKLSRANKECANLIRQHAPKFLQMKDEITRSDEQFLQATREIKQLGDQLHGEIKGIQEKLETNTSKRERLVDEESTGLENRKLFEHLQQLRDRWTADMEELIYVGWINACLRREILVIQDEERDEHEHEDGAEKPARDLGDEVVMELPVGNEHVRHCSVEFNNAEECPSSSSVADIEEICVDITAKRHDRGLKKPRMLHKIKGWAKGKGGCRKACNNKGNTLESMFSSKS